MWQFLIELYKTRALYSILTKFELFIIWRTDIKKKYSFHFSLEIDQRKHRIFNSSSFLLLFSFFSLSFSSSFFSLLPPQLQPTIEKLIYLLYITTLTIHSTSQSPIYNTPYKFFFFFGSLTMINTTQITQPFQPNTKPNTAPPQPTPSNHWQQLGIFHN